MGGVRRGGVVTIVVLIILGGAALVGFHPFAEGDYPHLFSNFTTSDGLFPHGLSGIVVTALAAFYALSGSELIGGAAGETADPARAIPRAIRTTVVRLLLFFVGSIVVIAATIPFDEVGLDESPFVTVFSRVGVPYAADIMNFVIITALLSAGNSGLFSCARMLFSLSEEGQAPAYLRRLSGRGIPLIALGVSMIGGLASLISSVAAPETVYLVLVSIAGFAVVCVWMSIAASQFFHRRNFVRDGGDPATLSYRTPLYPYVPILALTLCAISLIGIALDSSQVAALYFGVPFVVLCYLYHYIRYDRKRERSTETAAAAQSL